MIPEDHIILFRENEETVCAVRPGFIDLVVSIAGFGDNPTMAVNDLLENEANFLDKATETK